MTTRFLEDAIDAYIEFDTALTNCMCNSVSKMKEENKAMVKNITVNIGDKVYKPVHVDVTMSQFEPARFDITVHEYCSYEIPSGSEIKKVIFNNPATIILWADGTKTVVKCGEHEDFDPEKGFAMAYLKHALGNKGNYYNLVKRYVYEQEAK